ncbi:MAG: DUF2339 domain-containing protein [Sandaracinaceae bacterium]|nr:DUF2339 domain-containing protein [Sandaracinaceae bacterium]
MVASAPLEASSAWSAPQPEAAVEQGAVAPVPPAPPLDVRPPMPQPPPAGPPPRKGPGLEEWLGVRGIALLGALTLVVAGIYFFRYSVEHGLITPAMRVILGVVVGLACIGASERPLRSRHPLLANFIAGAGVAILYLASWSSGALYELVPRPAAFALMAVTTAACCALAIRHKALSIAMIGLLGGFITPISLSTGQDRPLALFGYLLLLDVALLAVAQRTRWGVLALLSVLGTFVYQVGWVMGRMGAERTWLGVAIVAMFALVFALGSLLSERKAKAEGRTPSGLEGLVTKATQALAILLPFLFPLFFAAHEDLRIDLLPTLVLVTALTIGAGVISLATRSYWLQVAAAAAGGVTLLVHVLAMQREPLGWLFAGVTLAVMAAHYAVVERWAFVQRSPASLGSHVGSPALPQHTEGFGFLPSHAFVLFVAAALFALLLGADRLLPAAATVTTLLVVSAPRGWLRGALHFVGALVAPLATPAWWWRTGPGAARGRPERAAVARALPGAGGGIPGRGARRCARESTLPRSRRGPGRAGLCRAPRLPLSRGASHAVALRLCCGERAAAGGPAAGPLRGGRLPRPGGAHAGCPCRRRRLAQLGVRRVRHLARVPGGHRGERHGAAHAGAG